MLFVETFTFNPFQENTYIVYNQHKNCWIIDPGMSNPMEQNMFVRYIDINGLKPCSIINTHAHIDHILGIDFIANKYKIPFYLHEKEEPILRNASHTAKMFGFDYGGVQTSVNLIKEDHSFTLEEEPIHLLLVPGHSPGSIALYAPKSNWVICGDTLFNGSIGRTDLLMGDYDTLIKSIKNKLLILPEDTTVYSGHGSATSIGVEKSNNPFLQN